MINEGLHTAKIADYGLQETDKGDLKLVIRFKTIDDQFVNWSSFLTSAPSLERLKKATQILGWDGQNPHKLALGSESQLLDMEKEVEINVSHESTQDGRTYPQVKFINELGGSANINHKIDLNKAALFFNGRSIDMMLEGMGDSKKIDDKTRVVTKDIDDLPF